MDLAAILNDPKALGTGGLALVIMWRIYVFLRRQDKSDKAQDTFRDDLMARCKEKEDQIERLTKRHQEALSAMGVRLDEARSAESDARAELAKLQGQFEHMMLLADGCDTTACQLKSMMD